MTESHTYEPGGLTLAADADRLQAEVQADNLIDDLRARLNDENVDWKKAMFSVIAEWPLPDEDVDGEHYTYLLDGEAFDWRSLADRLIKACEDAVDPEEMEALLLGSDPPDGMTDEEFVRILGFEKHRAHLNYLYGVTVERGLLLATEESIRKRRVSRGFSPGDDHIDDAYVDLYRALIDELLTEYSKDTGWTSTSKETKFNLVDSDAFTYWLFKRRFKLAEPARLASDTRKALEQLERMRLANVKRQAALRIYRAQVAKEPAKKRKRTPKVT
ncbi:MAG: hypothetical protein HQ478_06975 [Chloroflexi bacterium]|nr:hypothetical protein [Chloroflexota bacterium]